MWILGCPKRKDYILNCTMAYITLWVELCPLQRHSWRRKWQPTTVFLPGKAHGRRSLVGYSPWGRKESDTTEQLHFHFLSQRHSVPKLRYL